MTNFQSSALQLPADTILVPRLAPAMSDAVEKLRFASVTSDSSSQQSDWSQATPIECEEILRDFGFTPCDIQYHKGKTKDLPLGTLRKKFWNKKRHTKSMPLWQEWKDALFGPDRDDDLVELALKVNALQHEGDPIPSSEYYNCGQAFISMLSNTEGRVAVHPEYLDVWDAIEDRIPKDSRNAGLLIAGQRGAGKTYLMIYLLLRCLQEGKPVLLYTGKDGTSMQHSYLFTETGVYKTGESVPGVLLDDASSVNFFRAILGGNRIWALLLSRSSHSSLPAAYTSNFHTRTHRGFYPIVSGYPGDRIFNSYYKGQNPALYVLNPPTPVSILCGAVLLQTEIEEHRSKRGLNELLKALVRFGCAPRFCYDTVFYDGPTKTIENLKTGIEYCRFDILQQILDACNETAGHPRNARLTVPLSKLDPMLLEINRVVKDDGTHVLHPNIASAYIMNELLSHFCKKDRQNVRHFVRLLLRHSSLRGAAGGFFEGIIHHILSDAPEEWRSCMDLQPFDPWSADECPPNRTTIALSRDELYRERTLVCYGGDVPPLFHPACYFTPELSNNPLFDSVLYIERKSSASSVNGLPDNTEATQLVPGTYPAVSPYERPADVASFAAGRSRSSALRDIDDDVEMDESSDGVSTYGISDGEVSTVRGESPSRATSLSGDFPPPSSITSSTSYSDAELIGYHLKRKATTPEGSTHEASTIKRPRLDTLPEDQVCVALQMTVSSSHSTRASGFKRLARSFHSDAHRFFVFVSPKKSPLNIANQIAAMRANETLANTDAKRYRYYTLTVDLDHPWEGYTTGGSAEVVYSSASSSSYNEGTANTLGTGSRVGSESEPRRGGRKPTVKLRDKWVQRHGPKNAFEELLLLRDPEILKVVSDAQWRQACANDSEEKKEAEDYLKRRKPATISDILVVASESHQGSNATTSALSSKAENT